MYNNHFILYYQSIVKVTVLWLHFLYEDPNKSTAIQQCFHKITRLKLSVDNRFKQMIIQSSPTLGYTWHNAIFHQVLNNSFYDTIWITSYASMAALYKYYYMIMTMFRCHELAIPYPNPLCIMQHKILPPYTI